MFKRLLAALCAVALCTAMVGCGKTDTPNDQTTQEEQQAETKTVTLYLPDDQAESVVPTETEIKVSGEDEAADLMAALVEQGVQLTVDVEHDNRRFGDLVKGCAHLAGQQLAAGADKGPGLAHAAGSSCFSRISKRSPSRLGRPKRASP